MGVKEPAPTPPPGLSSYFLTAAPYFHFLHDGDMKQNCTISSPTIKITFINRQNNIGEQKNIKECLGFSFGGSSGQAMLTAPTIAENLGKLQNT